VTYLGAVWGTAAALRRMRPRDRGTIVQVGSSLALRGFPLQAPYCAAKHAMRGMTDSLRTELLHDGSKVRLTMVQLPALNTPQFDWGANHVGTAARPPAPLFQPEVAAEAVWRAAQGAPRELWLGWRNVLTILGSLVSPPLMDSFIASVAVEGQQREGDVPPQPYARHNLFEPVDDDQDVGMHGPFDDEALERSVQLDLRRLVPHPTAVLHAVGRGIARLVA
jgi:hypothetical protein